MDNSEVPVRWDLPVLRAHTMRIVRCKCGTTNIVLYAEDDSVFATAHIPAQDREALVRYLAADQADVDLFDDPANAIPA